MKRRVVVILSGGMDSTTLLYDAKRYYEDVHALSFDYNQRHKKELEFAKKTCEKLKVPHKIVNLSCLNELAESCLTRKEQEVPEGHYSDENMKQTVVPNRNMVMLALATAYAITLNASKVLYGAHSGDHDIYPDCRPEFVEKLNEAVKICDWRVIEIEAPYLDISKIDILKIGKDLEVDYSLTWTCYKGEDKPCGKCGSCVERAEAFEKNNMEDPLLK